MPIFKASQQGNLKDLQALVESNQATVNDRDKDNVTPLHWASINNHLPVVRYLIGAGAELDATGGELLSTPLHWAVRQGHQQVVHFLVKSGANIYLADAQGYNGLHLAAQYGHAYCCLYFLAHGMDIDVPDREKRTPLMWAVYKNMSNEIVPLLLKYNANVDLVDVIKCSALHWGALKVFHVPLSLSPSFSVADAFSPPEKTRETKSPAKNW